MVILATYVMVTFHTENGVNVGIICFSVRRAEIFADRTRFPVMQALQQDCHGII